MPTPAVSQFEITALDRDGLRRFYGLLFGWRLDADNTEGHKLFLVHADRNGVGGSIKSAGEVKSEGMRIIVEVDDVLEHVCYAEELGGRIIELPHEIISGGRRVTVASFVDPEGNRVGLSNGYARPAA